MARREFETGSQSRRSNHYAPHCYPPHETLWGNQASSMLLSNVTTYLTYTYPTFVHGKHDSCCLCTKSMYKMYFWVHGKHDSCCLCTKCTFGYMANMIHVVYAQNRCIKCTFGYMANMIHVVYAQNRCIKCTFGYISTNTHVFTSNEHSHWYNI